MNTIFKAILTVAILVGESYASGEVLVKAHKITLNKFHEDYKVVGKCESDGAKSYYSAVNGSVEKILVSNDHKIKKDDIIITIDEAIAKSMLEKSIASHNFAKSNYKRHQALLRRKMISPSALDKARLSYEVANAELESAKDKYSKMLIAAPFDGSVGVVHAIIGKEVKIGDYLFSLIPSDSKKIIFVSLPESMSGKITKNSEVYVTSKEKKKIVGKIDSISSYVNDSGTISVKLSFPKDSPLIHGSYIEANIVYNKHEALAVPEKIIMKNSQGNYIYKIGKDNKIQEVFVETKARTNNLIEVVSEELKVGDLVVLQGLTKVEENSIVKIMEEKGKK